MVVTPNKWEFLPQVIKTIGEEIMNDANMTDVGYNKATVRLLIVAIVMGFTSLALPWWTLVLFVEGSLASTFNLFLWGVIKTGFLSATLPFEWWSYTTFALTAGGAISGLGGLRLLTRGKKNGRILIASEVICTLSSCLMYSIFLLYTLATLFSSYQDLWMTVPSENYGSILIARLYIFNIRHTHAIAGFEFLNIGFFFAVAASALSMIVLYKIRKNTLEIT